MTAAAEATIVADTAAATYIGITLVREHGRRQYTVDLTHELAGLLSAIEQVQARQRGETILPKGDGLLAPKVELALAALSPAEVETCLMAGLSVLLNCELADGVEFMALTEDEGNVIRDHRAAKVHNPLDRRQPARV